MKPKPKPKKEEKKKRLDVVSESDETEWSCTDSSVSSNSRGEERRHRQIKIMEAKKIDVRKLVKKVRSPQPNRSKDRFGFSFSSPSSCSQLIL